MQRNFLKTTILTLFILLFGGVVRAGVLADTVWQIPNPYEEVMFVDVPESRDDSSMIYYLWQKEVEEEEIEELWQLREIFAYTSFNPNMIHYRHPDDVIQGQDTVWITLLDSCGIYTHPNKGRLTSPFGPRWGRMHYGTDIGLRTGDTIVAAFDGIVRIAQRNYSYGNIAILFHKNGLETYYAHMSRLLVQPNQLVKSGDPIGLGGNTGRSRGSHLHFEVRYLGAPIDAQYLIDFVEHKLTRETLPICKETLYSSSTTGARYHKVRQGETLSSIARRYHTTVPQLRGLNGLKSSRIRQGTVIRVR